MPLASGAEARPLVRASSGAWSYAALPRRRRSHSQSTRAHTLGHTPSHRPGEPATPISHGYGRQRGACTSMRHIAKPLPCASAHSVRNRSQPQGPVQGRWSKRMWTVGDAPVWRAATGGMLRRRVTSGRWARRSARAQLVRSSDEFLHLEWLCVTLGGALSPSAVLVAATSF
jgi:hypothetical protein